MSITCSTCLREPPHVVVGCQQPLDQLFALVGGRIGQEGAGFFGAGNAPGQIKIDAADEFGVGRAGGERPACLSFDKLIDADVQGVLGGRQRRNQPNQNKAEKKSPPRHRGTFRQGGIFRIGGIGC
jgi:hypothetical protein